MTGLDRRQFGASLAAGSLASALGPSRALAAPVDARFPDGFRWGAATAAYQIEGAPKEDGKGPSIWDEFSHTPGKIADGTNGDVACDSYHRYREDTQLLKNLGANAYRFSIAWPRIFPSGRGKPNAKGVDHYKRVIDNLLENGIEPFVTLYHWDLPAALPGGWQNRDTAKAFADYAGYMAGQLSDRVSHFMTTNEISSFVFLGYLLGQGAPGLKLPFAQGTQVVHNALLAHGWGVQAIRAHARSGTQVGLAENPRIGVPIIETPEHIAAAAKATRGLNANILAPILEGAYPVLPGKQPLPKPQIEDGDMGAIGSPLDFVALNIYTGLYVRADPGPSGYAVVTDPTSYPVMSVPWLKVLPESLYWGMRLTAELWKPKALYVSENGAASADTRVNGRIDDSDRLMYLREYIGQLHRATSEGYPVKGYFAWSLMDNVEWSEGHSKRFGLHYTDYDTQERIPKLSAAWFKELIARNALV